MTHTHPPTRPRALQGKARLGTVVHKKTATALALTAVKNEDQREFAKLVESFKVGAWWWLWWWVLGGCLLVAPADACLLVPACWWCLLGGELWLAGCLRLTALLASTAECQRRALALARLSPHRAHPAPAPTPTKTNRRRCTTTARA